MVELTENDLKRYDRQMRIWGEKGQKRLKKATVGIIGTGGLGSPITIYLAVAGIGKIIAADKDRVELSNLNRQILHWDKDIERKKADSAREKLEQMNPDIEIITYGEEVTEENIEKIFKGVNAVIDGLDNFPSRFILNEFAVRKKIPFFHGAVWGFEGRITTIIPKKTPCLKCIFPEAPPREVFPVVGVTPGVIGILQATEVIKYFTGVGKLLTNKLLIYHGDTLSFDEITIERNPECPVCGQQTHD